MVFNEARDCPILATVVESAEELVPSLRMSCQYVAVVILAISSRIVLFRSAAITTSLNRREALDLLNYVDLNECLIRVGGLCYLPNMFESKQQRLDTTSDRQQLFSPGHELERLVRPQYSSVREALSGFDVSMMWRTHGH